MAATAAYLVNAFFGDRIERKTTVMIGAILFAVSRYILYNVHDTAALYVLYILGNIGVVLWLWGMYAYIPPNFRPGCAPWARAGPTAWATWAPGAAPSSPGTSSCRARR